MREGKLLLLIPLVASLSAFSSSTEVSLLSSCSAVTQSTWKHKKVQGALGVWLKSFTTVHGGGKVQSALYEPVTQRYKKHFTGSGPDKSHTLTVGHFGWHRKGGSVWQPSGLAWQFRGSHLHHLEGWVYGQVDSKGRLLGANTTFLYPDLRTGLLGSWDGEGIEEATAVRVTGYRCQAGLMELELTPVAGPQGRVVWGGPQQSNFSLGRHPREMDPHEARSVYVAPSQIPESGEGLFSKRRFLPGQLVSYFGGTKTFYSNFVFKNMTVQEEAAATAVFYNLEQNSRPEWGLPEGLVLDVPVDKRTIYQYRTTLAHKSNCKQWKGINVVHTVVRHPFLGPVACLIATVQIERGEEIFWDYQYDTASPFTPAWYREQYKRGD